jgi:hypothetical protein
MTKQEAEELISEAKKYSGMEIKHVIPDKAARINRFVNCKFSSWRSITQKDENDQVEIKLHAELTAVNGNKIYTVPLYRVVDYFRKKEL